MKVLGKLVALGAATVIALALTACKAEGPAEESAEKIGKQLDETAEEAHQGLDQAGESVSRAVEKAGDKIESATD